MVLEHTMKTPSSVKTAAAFPMFGDPNDNPNNLQNPYEKNIVDSSRGETYFNAPAANSTMSSDNIEMVKRMRLFVPKSSVKEGRQPTGNHLGYEDSEMLENKGSSYKSTYQ